jgi:hypothetical protein
MMVGPSDSSALAPTSPNASTRNSLDRHAEMLGAVDVGAWYCDLSFDSLIWSEMVKEYFWLALTVRHHRHILRTTPPLDRHDVRAEVAPLLCTSCGR